MATISSVVLAAAPAHASPNPAGLWVSLAAEYRSSPFLREWAGFLSVNIPLDRIAAPRLTLGGQRFTEQPPKKESAATPPAPAPAPASPTAPPPTPAPVAPKSDASSALLTPRLARGAVRHALQVAGYLSTRARLSSLAARARSSAALPEVALRTQRTTGQTLRLTPTPDDPYRYTQAGTSELAFEARLTWHLDRLVFAGEEVSIERLQHQREAAERHLIEQVLQRLLIWQRGRARAADPDNEPLARETAELEALGAAVELDVLTDGWFSQAIGESESDEASSAGEPSKVEVNPGRHAR